ncbi:MAG: PDZ domain-containing protein, partial [Acidobacteriota bacterium]
MRLKLETVERSETSAEEIECERWGLTARGITRELALEFNLPDRLGVMVVGVKPNGPAFRARLFAGDRIVAIEERAVSGLDALREIYRDLDDSRAAEVLLIVMRRHSRRLVLVEASYEE